MPTPEFDAECHRLRRARIATLLREQNAALVLPGGTLTTRSNDTEHRFRPDSDFHYLTGLADPGSVLVLLPGPRSGAETLHLFVRPRDRQAEVWSGRRVGPEGAQAIYGADAAHPLSMLSEKLRILLDGVGTVYLPFRRAQGLNSKISSTLDHLNARNRYGSSPPSSLSDARALLGEERIHKDQAALRNLRRAIDLSANAHNIAMNMLRPGLYEYELEARIEYEFRRCGSSGPGYTTIVASGDNANILHYVANEDRCNAGDLVLIDAGAEWNFFSGDITRTLPVSGVFSGAQRDLYQIVLDANIAGIEAAVVGNTIEKIHNHSLRILCTGMHDLGLLKASPDEIIETELYKRFYPHRTSHWLGVDVHDPGRYTLGGKARPLEAGFVFTVEPGIYVSLDDDLVAPEFRGTGIRIEDDVLVRTEGPEVLSADVPKSVSAIQATMATKSPDPVQSR